MKKNFKRLLCLFSALCLVMTSIVCSTVSVSASDIEKWSPTKALTKDTATEIFSGITLTPAEDLKFASASTTIDGIKFTGSLLNTSGTNGKVNSSGVTGPVLKFSTTRTGVLSVAAKITVQSGKGIKVVNVKDINTVHYYREPSVATELFSFDVQAGETYYVWGTGTKPTFYGATFEEKQSVTVQEGENITIKATPNSNALIGNVRLGDSSVSFSHNDGMTENTFTMPSKNVDVYVDFVSRDVEKEIEAISFDLIKGTNASMDKIYDDLVLFDNIKTSIGDPDVSWESTNEDVISTSGEVNAQSTDTNVELTGVFSYQDYPNIFLRKTFSLTVPADTDDNAAVADAKASLTLGDTSSVKKNLELPLKGRRGTTISWSSSDESVVGTDGSVNPKNGTDSTVILTATISRGSADDTKEFTVFVPGIIPIDIERIAISNSDGEVVITPANNNYVSHIVYTDSINNKSGKEVINVKVYNSNKTAVVSEKDFNIKEYSEKAECKNGNETIIYIDKDALSVNADSVIEVNAYEDGDKKDVTLSKPYTYSYTVTSNPTVYVSGDSTACVYTSTGNKNTFPKTGWAQVLSEYFDSSVKVSDLALSGRSSLSFLSETNYKTIKNNIKSGDYFIIQFGHNDQKDDAARHTDPTLDRFTDGSYKKNLMENYVNVALDKGAYPILTTSISRRNTSDAGLEQYVNATKALGYELGLPVIDLYKHVNSYINSVGKEQACDIYNYVKAYDSRFINSTDGDFSKSQFYTTGTTDNTHININGARMISQWFCDELTKIQHPLVSRRNSKVMTIADIPSYKNATSVNVSAAADNNVSLANDTVSLADENSSKASYTVSLNYDNSLGSVEVITPSDEKGEFKINQAGYGENGKLTVDYDSNGTADVSKLIVATYSDENKTELIDAKVFELGDKGVTELDFTKPASGTVVLFVWDSLDNVNPLVDTYTVK